MPLDRGRGTRRQLHWTLGNPPGDTIPAAFLAVSFALLVLMVRLRSHLRAEPGGNRRLLVLDAGKVAAASGAVILLASGYQPGAVLVVATLLWLGLSARKGSRPGRTSASTCRASAG